MTLSSTARSWLVGAVCFLSVSNGALATPSQHFTALDVFELEYADNVAISHKGDHIVYERTSMDIMTDKTRKNVWIVSTDGRDHRPLLSGEANFTQPVWSPNDDRLAYLSNIEGDYQLYVRWMDTGQTALLTNLRTRPSHITWSPDGRQLAFILNVPDSRKPLAPMPPKPEGAQWAPPVIEIDSINYRRDGSGYVKPGHNHVFILPAEGGTPRQLTTGDFNHGGPMSWSPDGKTLYFSGNRHPDWMYQPQESEIFAVDLDTNELTAITERVGPDRAPTISPDGRYLAYLGHDERIKGSNPSGVYLLELASGKIEHLTPDFDRGIDRLAWAGNSRHLWVQYDDAGLARLGRLSLAGKLTPTPVTMSGTTLGRPYTSGMFSVSMAGPVAFTAGDVYQPADVGVLRNSQTPRVLTALNDDLLGHKTLGAVERMTWASSHDGLTIEGWLMTPPNFDPTQQYPLILEIHGGPHTAYGPNFSAEAQLFAAAGYVVLYANPRGSTSYGDDFANAIHRQYPGYDYDDLISGVDAAIAKGFIDPDNLFVTGGSGGGVLTAWIVGKTDRFRAAVVAKPVINWASFVLTADFSLYFSNYWFDQKPWEDIESHWKLSPLSLVGNVTTPTMLLTGEADYRTPISETEQYYQALKLRRIDTVMVRIPEASHGIYKRPSNLIAKVNNILAWFERYRRSEES
jgi:acylaminoacyl-peptidase